MKPAARRCLTAALLMLGLAPAVPAAAEPTDAVRYPFIAAFSRQSGDDRVYFCTGALVAPQWILTAAHCFHSRAGTRLPIADMWAAVGRDRLRRAEETAQLRVDEIVVFPGYIPATQHGDLALVRLEDVAGPLVAEPDDGATGAPARAVVLGFASFYEGRLAGNALTASGAPAAQLGDRLARAEARLVDPGACADRGIGEGGDLMLCGAAAPELACIGDSGGPLVAEAAEGPDRLIGVVSLGTGCAVDRPLVAYTRVGAYADWIAATLAND